MVEECQVASKNLWGVDWKWKGNVICSGISINHFEVLGYKGGFVEDRMTCERWDRASRLLSSLPRGKKIPVDKGFWTAGHGSNSSEDATDKSGNRESEVPSTAYHCMSVRWSVYSCGDRYLSHVYMGICFSTATAIRLIDIHLLGWKASLHQ